MSTKEWVRTGTQQTLITQAESSTDQFRFQGTPASGPVVFYSFHSPPSFTPHLTFLDYHSQQTPWL